MVYGDLIVRGVANPLNSTGEPKKYPNIRIPKDADTPDAGAKYQDVKAVNPVPPKRKAGAHVVHNLRPGDPELHAVGVAFRKRRNAYIDRLDASTQYIGELESMGTGIDHVYRGLIVWLLTGIRDGSFKIRHAGDAATLMRVLLTMLEQDPAVDQSWREQVAELSSRALDQVEQGDARPLDEPQQDAPSSDDDEE